MTTTAQPLRPYQIKFQENRQEYQDYLPLTERIQANLRNDADELGAQESWDPAAQRGVIAWLEDKSTVYRFLKRNAFKEKKAYAVLLNALSNRITHNLHQPISSILPYSGSALFYILPLPKFKDRLGRPIVVISPREVVRDKDGSLENLTQWLWSASEMLRRTITDYWGMKRWNGSHTGSGGEGCVAIIDASGAGYRNLEVELLPTLANVGSKNFPGMIESIYVVNAGWTQRRLWGVVKNVLPRSALERIIFIDDSTQLAEFFDLDHLPKFLGGKDPYEFDGTHNPILEYYQAHSIGSVPEASLLSVPRTASFASAAEVFYTAANTPAPSPFASRQPSMDGNVSSLGDKFHMTPAGSTLPPSQPVISTNTASIYPSPVSPTPQSPFDEQFATSYSPDPNHMNGQPSEASGSMTPLQRIRSLADFKLYLSPSRLAQVELLSESDDETPTSARQPPTIEPLPRRILRPALLEPSFCSRAETLASRRSRPPLRLLAVPGLHLQDESVRTYSDRIASHHARELKQLDGASPIKSLVLEDRQGTASSGDVPPEQAVPAAVTTPEPSHPSSSCTPSVQLDSTHPTHTSHPARNISSQGSQAISAYSRSSNPWYGYPAIRLPDPSHPGSTSIQPRYPRRRKRDLVKTLLFLFLIRLQSWRDTFERALGLNRLSPWVGFRHKWKEARNPSEGLIQEAEHERHLRGQETTVSRKGWDADWAWMVVGFMLMRGTWTRLLAIPLEAMGLDTVRDLLGL